MEDKLQDNTSGLEVAAPDAMAAVKAAPIAPTEAPKRPSSTIKTVLGIVFVLAIVVGVALWLLVQPKAIETAVGNRFSTVELPLDEFSKSGNLELIGAHSLVINGPFIANDTFTVSPSAQPTSASAGLIYYDQTSNQLAYYNGSEFIPVTSSSEGTVSTGGVLSLQGQAGNITLVAGNGIAISGTTISATNSSSLTLISESGTTVTVSGDLQVTGALSLGTKLSVANGGTGGTTFTANGVLIGNGTSAITAVTASSSGQCLLSTSGAPAFSTCPGGSGGGNGVDSLNNLTGSLTLANSSGAGNAITIDDATTGQKGIAQFSATNFSVAAGLINTVQDIALTASPTFVGVTLSGDLAVNGGDITSSGALNVTPGGALVVGATGQTLTLQGSITTITSTGAGNDVRINSADTIELQDNTNVTGALSASGAITATTLGSADSVTYVCRNAANQLATCQTTATGSAFVQGGNSFGATATLGTNDANDLVIERNNITQLTVGSGTVTLASGGDLLLSGAASYISNPQDNFGGSEAFGLNATVSGAVSATAVGNSASALGGRSVAFGREASANFDDGVVLGFQANNTNSGGIAIGYQATAGFSGIAIGYQASAAVSSSISIKGTTTAANQLVVGGTDGDITSVFFGSGVTDATPAGFTLNATGGSGTDIAGAGLTIAGGRGTGTGNGGNISFQIADPGASGASANALASVLTLSGINGATTLQNTTNSTSAFRVLNAAGTTTALNVDSSNGRVGINTTTPSDQLTVNGNFTLRDADTATKQYRLRTSGSDLDFDAANAKLFFSVYDNADFSGTQRYKLVLEQDTDVTQAIKTWQFRATADGTTRHIIDGSVGGLVVFNENSEATDFRIEGDADVNALFVKGSNDRTGIGTNDPQAKLHVSSTAAEPLFRVTDGTATAIDVLSIADEGAATFQNRTNSTSGFNIENASGGNLFTLDTTNSRAGVNLGGNNVPTNLSGAGLEVNGAITIIGDGSSAFTDEFSTPLGTALASKFNIASVALTGTAHSAIYAGLLSGSSATARGITILDARTVAHHPSIAVISPNENHIGGFSWEGSNGDFYIKNSAAGSLIVQLGGTDEFAVLSDRISAQGDFVPGTASTYTLGRTGSEFNQLFLGNDEGVTFGTSQQANLVFDNATDGRMELTGTSATLYIEDGLVIGASDTTGALLILDTKTNTGDPTGVAGGMYYNSATKQFRCYQDGDWVNCVGIDPTVARKLPFYSNDFAEGTIIASFLPWTGVAASGSAASGTLAGGLGTSSHPGVVTLQSNAGAVNSGYRMVTSGNFTYFGGGEMFEAIINPTTLTNVTSRLGFHDTGSSAAPADGAWIEISGTTLSGKTSTASTASTTGTTLTVSTSTWYRLRVAVNTAASTVTYTVYNDSGTVLWTDSLSTNIPTTSSNLFGCNLVSTISTATTADLMNLDYMAMWWENTRALTR